MLQKKYGYNQHAGDDDEKYDSGCRGLTDSRYLITHAKETSAVAVAVAQQGSHLSDHLDGDMSVSLQAPALHYTAEGTQTHVSDYLVPAPQPVALLALPEQKPRRSRNYRWSYACILETWWFLLIVLPFTLSNVADVGCRWCGFHACTNVVVGLSSLSSKRC